MALKDVKPYDRVSWQSIERHTGTLKNGFQQLCEAGVKIFGARTTEAKKFINDGLNAIGDIAKP
jgi:3-methyladenine DNA glycosylase AlkD